MKNYQAINSGSLDLDFDYEDETGSVVTYDKFYLQNERFLKAIDGRLLS